MATHGDGPDPRDPHRQGYLSSLGLDEPPEPDGDGADDVTFGTWQPPPRDPGSSPTPQTWAPDPTAAWVLPQEEGGHADAGPPPPAGAPQTGPPSGPIPGAADLPPGAHTGAPTGPPSGPQPAPPTGPPSGPVPAAHPGYAPHPGYPEPHHGYADPNQGYADPNQGYAPPHPGHADPNQGYAQPHPGHADPNQGYAQPHPAYADPNQGYAQPHPAYADPNQAYAPPHPGYADPYAELAPEMREQDQPPQPGQPPPLPVRDGSAPPADVTGPQGVASAPGPGPDARSAPPHERPAYDSPGYDSPGYERPADGPSLSPRAADTGPRAAPRARGDEEARQGGRMSAEMLTADTVLRTRRPRPTRGWRRGVYSATGGRLNLGPSGAELREQELMDRARTPLDGCHRLAVISLKGGVGKTTTTAALGAMFASLRGDRVVALDANPDRGTLGERVPRESQKTVRDLLDARDDVTRYADVRHYTSQAATRLEVLASDADPGVSQAFSEADYRDTVNCLERFYNLILTDCGTGLLHSAMQGILGLADSLVIVSSASLDGARSAAATLDWLDAHGFADIVSGAVTVISTVRPGGGTVDVDRLEEHFAQRCRSVVSIPYDPHLEEGGVLDLDELNPDTRESYYELAAEVGEGFTGSGRGGGPR